MSAGPWALAGMCFSGAFYTETTARTWRAGIIDE